MTDPLPGLFSIRKLSPVRPPPPQHEQAGFQAIWFSRHRLGSSDANAFRMNIMGVQPLMTAMRHNIKSENERASPTSTPLRRFYSGRFYTSQDPKRRF
jgi:hypothetical protein